MLGNVCGLELQQAFVACRLVRAVSSSEGGGREWKGSRADRGGGIGEDGTDGGNHGTLSLFVGLLIAFFLGRISQEKHV